MTKLFNIQFSIFLYSLLSNGVFAQESDTLDVKKLENQKTSVQRIFVEKALIGQSSQTVSSEDISRLNPMTTAEILQKSGLAAVQTSQVGGGSPILRGFEANRILTVIDGVRMNNAIYRGGHLQSLITVDPFALESLELLLGPGSVAYGSDALGGVVVLKTLHPTYKTGEKVFNANGAVRFGSAATSDYGSKSNSTSLHADWNVGLADLPIGFLTSLTLSQRGDLRIGSWSPDADYSWGKTNFIVDRIGGKDSILINSDPLVQSPSGYSQTDFMQKMAWALTPHLTWNLNYQFSNSTDIPRFDRLSEMTQGKPSFAEWYYGPQKRILASSEWVHQASSFIWDQAQFLLSYQNAEESRMNRRLNKPMLRSQIENIDVYRLNVDMNKQIANHTIRYGAELGYDDVQSKAFQDSVDNGGLGSTVATRYPQNGSSLFSQDVYAGDLWNFAPNWSFDVGSRFHAQQLNADFGVSPLNFPFQKVTQNNSALTGSTALVWAPKSWKLSALASTGFKAPNVDDMGKVFDSDKSKATLVVPNKDLKPEYSFNGEVGIEKSWGRTFVIEGRAYQTWLEDAFAIRSTTFNGSSVVDFDGVPAKVLALQNSGGALIQGWSVQYQSTLFQSLNLNGGVSLTQGFVEGIKNRPLDHQHPLHYNQSMAWNAKSYEAQVSVLGMLKKPKSEYYNEAGDYFVGEDNFEYATADGLPAWWVLNARAAYKYNKEIQVQTGLDNIFDRYYRTVASGSGAPGRTLFVSVKAGF